MIELGFAPRSFAPAVHACLSRKERINLPQNNPTVPSHNARDEFADSYLTIK
jgi:hypothetical protein